MFADLLPISEFVWTELELLVVQGQRAQVAEDSRHPEVEVEVELHRYFSA